MTAGRPLSRVAVVALGGTIASIPGPDAGATPTLGADALAAAVPALETVARIETASFRTLPGAHLTTADMIALAGRLGELRASGVNGVVVTQGTDTIEETAFALDLLVPRDFPTVVTGAMRGSAETGADGPANLLAAVQVAAGGTTAMHGVVVVLDDAIHAARWVRKAHSTRPSAFASPSAGHIGWISEGKVTLALIPAAGAPQLLGPFDRAADVALLATWGGDDGRLIRAAASAGYAGMVIAALGGGHVAAGAADAIGEVAGAVPVVIASSTGAGGTLARTYGFAGSERDLVRRGAILSGPLTGTKARVLLELILKRGGEDPRQQFARHAADGAVTTW